MNGDEARLLAQMQRKGVFNEIDNSETAAETADRLGIPRLRACEIFRLWFGRRWYDWGFGLDWGWLTEVGMRASQESRGGAHRALRARG